MTVLLLPFLHKRYYLDCIRSGSECYYVEVM